jgi:hypothetical protein
MNKIHQANVWVYTQCVKTAINNDLPIEFSKEELMRITDHPCVYCGEEPLNFKRSLVDRLVPDSGFVAGNVVPACKLCVRTKGACDVKTFLSRCWQISYVHGGPGGYTNDWNDVKFKTYDQYKSENYHKDFRLTPEEYYALRSGNCTYCQRETTKTHTNGIDRVDNDVGYVFDNCVTCCHDCNMLKLVTPREEFIAHVIKIATRVRDISRQHP